MTIQEYTQKIEHLRWVIESKKEKVLVLESIATNTTQNLTGMPHNPSPSQSRMADAVCKIVDLEASIKQDEAEIERLKTQMSVAIDQVEDPKHRAVLYKRLIRNMTLDQIAEEIAYCRKTAQRFLKAGIERLEIILKKS